MSRRPTTPLPSDKIAPTPLTADQLVLIEEVAEKMAKIDGLIGAALLSSEGGPFAHWLHNERNKSLLGVVQNFDGAFMNAVKGEAGFSERFRSAALAHRQDFEGSAKAAGGAGMSTVAETMGPTSTASLWTEMDPLVKKEKWKKFFSAPSSKGTLRYLEALRFLDANIKQLEEVNEAWQAYCLGPHPAKRSQSLTTAPVGLRSSTHPSKVSSASLGSLCSLVALASLGEAEGPSEEQMAVVAEMQAEGATGAVGRGGVLLCRTESGVAPSEVGAKRDRASAGLIPAPASAPSDGARLVRSQSARPPIKPAASFFVGIPWPSKAAAGVGSTEVASATEAASGGCLQPAKKPRRG